LALQRQQLKLLHDKVRVQGMLSAGDFAAGRNTCVVGITNFDNHNPPPPNRG